MYLLASYFKDWSSKSPGSIESNKLRHHSQIDSENELLKSASKNKIHIILPDLNNIAFIWHHVYNYEEPKNIYVLEIQILPGSSNFVYKSPSDIWFRQAGTTKNVDLEEAISILQQRKESMDENQIHCCPPLQMDSE